MRQYLVVIACALVVSAAGAASTGVFRDGSVLPAAGMEADLAAIRSVQRAEAHRVPVLNRSGEMVIAVFDGHDRYGGWGPEFLAGATIPPDAVRFIDFSGEDGECLRHLYIIVRGREDEAHPLSVGPEDLCTTTGIQIGRLPPSELARGAAT